MLLLVAISFMLLSKYSEIVILLLPYFDYLIFAFRSLLLTCSGPNLKLLLYEIVEKLVTYKHIVILEKFCLLCIVFLHKPFCPGIMQRTPQPRAGAEGQIKYTEHIKNHKAE